MENRTIVFKDIINKLEMLNSDDFSSAQQLFSTAKSLLNAARELENGIRGMKTQITNQFGEQAKKFTNLSDDKIKKDLGVDHLELESIINMTEKEEDFDKIIDVSIKIMEYNCKKAPFFSGEKKQAKEALKGLIVVKENFNKFFTLYDTINNEIKIHRIGKGDISVLTEKTNIPILLGRDEKCYIKVDGVELYEDVAVRDTVGGYSGFSFRIAKGVSYRIGGMKAKGESHMEKRLIDKGAFYVTNKRYIYDGSTKNIDGELEEIISVEAYSDGIKISRANKRDEVFVGDIDGEYIGAIISGLVKNIR